DRDIIFLSLSDADKQQFSRQAAELAQRGCQFAATPGTAGWLQQQGLNVLVEVTDDQQYLQLLQEQHISMALITATKGNRQGRLGFQLRSTSVQKGIPLFTSIETFSLFCQANETMEREGKEQYED